MIKKIIMMMSAAVAMVCVQAATTYTEMVDGIEWTYTVTNGKASVGGGSWDSPAVPISTSGEITIPSKLGDYPVTMIGNCAFEDCRSLTSVTIPDSVASIGDDAFSICSSLMRVTIGDGVTSIGDHAFYDCSSLTSVTIGKSVTSIGISAFYCCSSLTSVTIPDSVTSIGDHAFYDCSSLASVTIPDGVTSIGYSAFMDCSSLTSVMIGNSVTSIGNYAFSSCSSLTSVTIPDSVTSIESRAFFRCDSLQAIIVDDDNNNYKSLDGLLLSKDGEILVACPGVKKSVVIPDGVKSIESVSGCSSLTSVTIPNSVTSIESGAFSGCSSLASITMLDGVTRIGYDAFRGCSSLTCITIPDSVTSIGIGAFDGCIIKNATLPGREMSINLSSVTNIVILEGTTEIDFYAFEDCSSLTSITIPGSVTNINQGAFSGCSSLTSVTIPYGVTRIGYEAFRDCGSLTSVTIPDSVTFISDCAFENCSSLMNVTIPDSVTSIGRKVFGGCGALADSNGFVIVKGVLYDYLGERGDVVIPNSVMRIGYEVFRNCSSLTSVIIPDSVTSIEELAFCDCSSLTSITIPDSVTSIGDWAFCGCSSLTSVIIPNSLTSIGRDTFDRCSSLRSVTIPDSVTSIGEYAFYNCSSLTSVTIPEGVTNIGVQALTYCSSLTNVIFQGNAPKLMGSFLYVHPDCTAYVKKNSTGWGVDIPGKWQGINIAYLEEDESTSITYSYDQIANGEIVLTDIIGEVPENWVCPSMYEGNKVVGLGHHFLAESEEIRSVVLADTIREVGESAFKKCPNLSSVILNEGLEIIRGYAFRKCFSLESVILPSSISIIEERAFCRSGENYRWDEGEGIGIQRIEIRGGANDAFSCEDGVLYDKINKKVIMARANIERVVLPEDCTRIGDCAFLSCYNLKEVVWNTALSEIGDEAFAGTYLTTGDLSKTSLTLAQEQAFAGCPLKEVVFPSTLRTVGSHLFGLCDSLESVRFLGNAPEIDNSAEETEEGFPAGDIYVTISSGSVEDVYDIHLPNVTTFVEKGTSGWDEVPGTWQGRPINYWSMSTDPIPDLGASATASEVAAALDGSADANLAENIKTAVEYSAYRTWALKLGGVTPREVKDSPNAWLSYALDTDALIAVAPKEEDVVIDTFKSAATDGAFEFTVKIDGIEVGDNALEANIRKVFDIEGIEKLESGSIGFSSDNVEVNAAASVNGDVKFTVTPKSANGKNPNSFFFRVRMK